MKPDPDGLSPPAISVPPLALLTQRSASSPDTCSSLQVQPRSLLPSFITPICLTTLVASCTHTPRAKVSFLFRLCLHNCFHMALAKLQLPTMLSLGSQDHAGHTSRAGCDNGTDTNSSMATGNGVI